MEGLEKLEQEILEMNNHNVTAVFEYLKTRTDLYDKFKNEEKSAKQMWDYICDKARKQAINNVAMVADNLVYVWAVTYFMRSNEALGIKEKQVMPPTSAEVIKKNEEKETTKTEEEKQKDTQITLFEEVQK